MAEETDYEDREPSSSEHSSGGSGKIFGLAYWEIGLIAVGALVLYFVVFRRASSGSSSTGTTSLVSPSVVPSASTSSGGSGSSSSGGSGSSSGSSTVQTWLQNAQNLVGQLGFNNSYANSAIQNYVAGNPIPSGTQTSIIHSIINILGNAPGITPTYGGASGTKHKSAITKAIQDTEYFFSAAGNNSGVTTVANGAAPVMKGSGFNASTNSHYLALANPTQMALAQQRHATITYQPYFGDFVPSAGHKLAPGTTLFAET